MYKNNQLYHLRFKDNNNNFPDWEELSLGELFIQVRRPKEKPTNLYSAIGIRSHFKGTFQKLNVDPSKNEMEELYEVFENDLIVNITFAWEGAVAIASKTDQGCLVSHRFPTFVNKDNGLNINFFKYIYPNKRFKRKLELISPGGAGRNRVLKIGEFLKLRINIPTLPEQTKIANFLSAVDDKISQLKKKKDLLEKYKKGVMQKIFSQELKFKDDNGQDFPEWEEKKLGEVVNIKSGLSRDQNGNIDGLKVTRIETISDGTIDLNKIGYIDVIDNVDSYKLIKGDILFSNINSVTHVGKTAIVYSDMDLYHGMNLLCLKNLEIVNPFFLFFFLNTVELRNYFRTICNKAVNQASINQTELAKTELYIPSLPEQIKIANFISAIYEKMNHCNKEITVMENWKKGLLQRMFV